MLELINLQYAYKPGKYAVNNVSLTIADGEFVGVAGRNGSGKTTMTRLVMALMKPLAGKILLDGEDTANFKTAAIARQIGYVFQNPDRQIFRDTVFDEVAYGPQQLGFSESETKQAVEEVLAVTGLGELARAYPRTLSKGQKQRLAIASALAMKPRMLILDEPTSGQDALEKNRLMELLAGLNAKGMAVLLITHDMELLLKYTKRVIVMAEGSKVFDGSPAQLFAGGSPVEKWGLRIPAALKIAGQLKKQGLDISALAKLHSAGQKPEGGEENA